MTYISDQQRGKRLFAHNDTSEASGAAMLSSQWSVRHLLLLFVFCLAIGLASRTMFAQSANALISGTVTDPRGASIPGATVTVTDQLTTTSQTTQTNDTGLFVFPEIRPGTYTLSV
jgi:hypothetical protein